MGLKEVFAILAVICWALDAFHVNLANIGLFSLGWAFAGISVLIL